MERAPIGRTARFNVPEQDRVALAPTVAPADRGKIGLTSVEIIAQINEEGRQPLPTRGDVACVTGRAGSRKSKCRKNCCPGV